MATPRILVRNLSSSWAGSFVYAVTAFILTPIVLESIGTTQFALWALVTGFTGYYGLLDLGFRSGLNRYIAKYRAHADWENLSRVASTGTAVLTVCGLILWCVTWTLTYLAPYLFPTTPENVTPLRWAVFLMGTSLSLQFPFFVQSAVFVATQRFDLANLIGIVGRLTQVTAVLVVLRNGMGLVGLSAAVAVTELGTYAVRYRIAARLIPELRISPRYVCRATLKKFTRFSAWATMSRFSSELIGTSDRYVVAFLLGAASVTRFQLAFTLTAQIRQVFLPFGRVFYPALCDLDEAGRKQDFVSLYLAGSRAVVLFLTPVVMIGFAWAPDFYRLWIGPKAVGGGLPQAATIFQILIFGTLLRIPQHIGYQIFHARFQLPRLTRVMIIEALSNVALSVILGSFFGLMGVATATVITGVVFEMVLLPWMIARELELSLRHALAATWLRPALVGALLLPVIIVLRALGAIESWTMLAAVGTIAGGAAAILLLFVGLTRKERERYVWSPLSRHLSPSKKATTKSNGAYKRAAIVTDRRDGAAPDPTLVELGDDSAPLADMRVTSESCVTGLPFHRS